MYRKEEYDYLFYRMKSSIPNNKILFYFVSVMKLYPLFVLVHSGGYPSEPNSLLTVHTFSPYFSLSYYLLNSFTASSLQILKIIITIINILIVGLAIYYLTQAKKIKKLDENYDNSNSLGYLFYIYSNVAFFKYIILFQFFLEISALPLMCIPNAVDRTKIIANAIFSESFFNEQHLLCEGRTFILLTFLSVFNITIDVLFYYFITSRFFDFNILSTYLWNFYPNLVFSFEFMESCVQIFFILFMTFNTLIYKIALNTYIAMIFLVKSFQHCKSGVFCTADTSNFVFIAQYIRLMCYTSTIFISLFQFGFDVMPDDISIIGLLIFEFIFVYLFMKVIHLKDKQLIHNILVANLNELTEKTIYNTLIFLIKEFRVFSDVGHKFSDTNLDLFLENYVNHLKKCDDLYCPCKNYVKKITGASNTIKSGYTTVINFTHMKKDKNEEYILNKFFNVLAANINATLKYTNNVNINNMKDSQRQKLIYQLRTKLIIAVRKLLSYRMEKLTREIESILFANFKKDTKDFIRINFYSVNILLNKSYYKTQFLYYEFLNNYFKRQGKDYSLNMIYYLYLKMFSVKEYNEHLAISKQGRREHSNYHYMDFRTVLSLCVKYYEIEKRVIKTSCAYEKFIQYFVQEKIVFDNLLNLIKAFKTQYKSVTQYISHYFKHEKINNLFVCTKIILFYKVLHFDIPEVLHNKLIIQRHETEDLKSTTSNSNNESCYYMILNYIDGEFMIKFISHELLIVLEYNEDEIRDQDFNFLLPEKLRKLHKNVIINEIKTHATNSNAKEIFFVSKSNTCVLFDIQYKFLLNLKGEITLLTIVNLKKPSKDFKVCFACIDDHGEILALNKEFEEYLILSMKLINCVKIDTESLIFQNNSQRMRNFFKDEENTDYQENFDYDLFLSSLFEEEFDILKEKDEKEYRKKYARWEMLKEMNRKGNYYTRFIDLNIKQRIMGKEILYFAKYSVKITLSLRSIEPHSTTISFIHAVKISKREMAKLSFYRGDEIYETKSEKSVNEEKINESHDDLFESQSQISSAITQLKERNSIRLFKQKKTSFKIIPKGKNIFWLMISIGIIGICSIVYNLAILIVKKQMYKTIHDCFNLEYTSLIIKHNIYSLSSAILTMALTEEGILSKTNLANEEAFMTNLDDMFEKETQLMNDASYNMSFLSSQFYSKIIETTLSSTGAMSYIFSNGFIYSKDNVPLFQELISINKLSKDYLFYYDDNYGDTKDDVFKRYYFLDQILHLQGSIDSLSISLNEKGISIYFLMNNIYETFDAFIDLIIAVFKNEYNSKADFTIYTILIIKIAEFVLICIIITIEWVFVYCGFAEAKKKMVSLKTKVERSNLELTLKKVNEFIHFSNNFNINSLYFIADLDIKRVDESSKTCEFAQSSSSKNQSTLMSNTNSNINVVGLTPRKKNLTSQMLNGNLRDSNTNDRNKNSNANANDIINDEKDIPMKMFNSNSNSNSNLNDFNTHNSNPKIPMMESKEGKNNLLKVMHKLDQIKGIQKNKGLEKRESELSNKSKKSQTSSNDSERNINDNGNGNGNNTNKNDKASISNKNSLKSDYDSNANNKHNNNNNESNDENDEYSQIGKEGEDKFKDNYINSKEPLEAIKSALKHDKCNYILNTSVNIQSSTKGVIRFADDNNNLGEDDSKLPIIKPNEEGMNLMKKNARTTKVKFKEHNAHLYKYYNPGQNVNEVIDVNQSTNVKASKLEKDSKETLGDKGGGQNDLSTNNNQQDLNNKQHSLLSTIQSNSKSNFTQPGQKESKVKFDLKTKENAIANKDSHFDMKDNNGLNKFHLIDQGKAITVKKKVDVKDNKVTQKEIIKHQIENGIYKNVLAKLILHINLLLFTAIYITSITLNFLNKGKIDNSSLYTALLINKHTLYRMIVLRYEILVMKGLHDDSLTELVSKTNDNQRQLTLFTTGEYEKIFPSVFIIESVFKSNDSCALFADYYSKEFNTQASEELAQCLSIANQLNSNGFLNAETYIMSTLVVHLDDWKNIFLTNTRIDEDLITKKLNDISYLNIIIDLDTTMRKYHHLLLRFILRDVNKIFDAIIMNEEIFGYMTVCLNIVFLLFSMVFIIYPIKFVEMIISWFIHKIMKS